MHACVPVSLLAIAIAQRAERISREYTPQIFRPQKVLSLKCFEMRYVYHLTQLQSFSESPPPGLLT